MADKKAQEEIVAEELTADQVEVVEELEAQEATDVAVEDDAASDEDGEEVATAKAGKRSAKAIREAEAEEARLEAAEERKDAEPVVKVAVKHTPNYQKRLGKKYRGAQEKLEVGKLYELAEAISLAKATSTTKFDGSIELHVNLGVDPRQADQMVRSSVVLPAGSGKTVRVAVLAPADKLAAATEAGADIVSDGDLLAQIEKGKLDFDQLIATPDMMGKLGKVAKVLGPRGLMPNPKSGTVTPNPAAAVKAAKGGKVEFRIDKQAIVHLAFGKASFSEEDLTKNVVAVLSGILQAKPSATKGTYIKAISLASSMGPGIKLDVQKAIAEVNAKR